MKLSFLLEGNQLLLYIMKFISSAIDWNNLHCSQTRIICIAISVLQINSPL